MIHYLDNAATEMVLKEAKEKAIYTMEQAYGNPSSTHDAGIAAARSVDEARGKVANALGADKGEVFFTSGGTEAINTAIMGAAAKFGRKKKTIITTNVEHPATNETLKRLSHDGFKIVEVKVGKDGCVSAQDVLSKVDDDTFLLSIMMINNETGAIMPVKEIKSGLSGIASGALLHVDAVQAFLKTEEKLAKYTGADFISVSGHKIGAVKGAGALYIKKGIKIPCLISGGGQEGGMRSGTEPVPIIAAFGEACEVRMKNAEGDIKRVKELSRYIKNGMNKRFPDMIWNSSETAAPNILNFSLPRAKSEVLLNVLSERNVFVSSGSACAKGKRSEVLTKMGVAPRVIDSAIRVSLSPENTRDDADALISALFSAMKLFENGK